MNKVENHCPKTMFNTSLFCIDTVTRFGHRLYFGVKIRVCLPGLELENNSCVLALVLKDESSGTILPTTLILSSEH